ncbi:glycoside hydrolase family 43 protein [Paenibacillus sp. MMS20-IR301]|uniref:glycoside hydrolase family 43 protein n=1 Tax=Paenibacillus sp. MMS20-IR301 TaxID=2895946 RepID=UPI0037C64AB4
MQYYENPVIPGFHPDPSVCRVGSDYYLVTSSFQYFPGVPVFHSRDLVNWQQIGHCLTRKSQLDLGGCASSMGIFAPTLRFHQGRFYMITTNTHSFRNFYVWSEAPEGPWSEPVWLDWPGIDPSLFFDEDNRVYLTGNGGFRGDEPRGIYQAELDIETGKLLTERRFIWSGTGGKAPEAPHLYRIQGMYYLLIAEGGTEYGHMVTVARSASPYGPFQSCPSNPILTHRSLEHPIQATGHADLVQHEDGSWWAVFLGIRPAPVPFGGQHHYLGRETFLSPVTWSEDGWPVIGDQGTAGERMELRSLRPGKRRPWNGLESFDSRGLPPEWSFLRNPAEGSWSLEARPGWLSLTGLAATLDDVSSPAFAGRRQQHFNCRVSAFLSFDPQQEGEEAGLTVYMNERYHYEIAVRLLDGRRQVILRRRAGALWKVEQEAVYEGTEIILTVQAEPALYTFGFCPPEEETVAMGTGECSLLSTEVAGGFTGVHFGLYATGNGKRSAASADFGWFKYEVLA